MRIVFEGIERAIEVSAEVVSVLQIENNSLFAAVSGSLLSARGKEAQEPYSLWDAEDNELNPKGAFLVVGNPLELPWTHKQIGGKIYERMNALVLEDEKVRGRLSELSCLLNSSIAEVGFQLRSDFCFPIEWDLGNYLKCVGFALEDFDNIRLFDNLIKFLDLLADVAFKTPLVFINLKTFLSKNELVLLYDHLVFLQISALLIENKADDSVYRNEVKVVVEQELLEYTVCSAVECPSSKQGRICANGFGAVTF